MLGQSLSCTRMRIFHSCLTNFHSLSGEEWLKITHSCRKKEQIWSFSFLSSGARIHFLVQILRRILHTDRRVRTSLKQQQRSINKDRYVHHYNTSTTTTTLVTTAERQQQPQQEGHHLGLIEAKVQLIQAKASKSRPSIDQRQPQQEGHHLGW